MANPRWTSWFAQPRLFTTSKSFGMVSALYASHDALFCRLIELVAEDNAIEDTMYHLHKALNTGRIDLDRFIKV